MFGLSHLAQLDSPSPTGWWWQTLMSGPALLLLALALACVFALVFLGWRLRRVSAVPGASALRERFSDDAGVATIEFVLVTPFLLGITLVLLQTMLVFTGLFYVQYSAFAAARSAIVQIPADLTEPSNMILPVRGSDKYDAIQSAAIIGVLPVSGREEGDSVVANTIVQGMSGVFQQQGRAVPPWVDGMLAQRLNYATNHTEVVIEKVTTEDQETAVFTPTSGLTEFSPKEAVAVRVRHQFALSIPVANQLFTLGGTSGSYQPASREGSSPGPPGTWTMIEARAILTNEGIDRRLPEAPPVPRR